MSCGRLRPAWSMHKPSWHPIHCSGSSTGTTSGSCAPAGGPAPPPTTEARNRGSRSRSRSSGALHVAKSKPFANIDLEQPTQSRPTCELQRPASGNGLGIEYSCQNSASARAITSCGSDPARLSGKVACPSCDAKDLCEALVAGHCSAGDDAINGTEGGTAARQEHGYPGAFYKLTPATVPNAPLTTAYDAPATAPATPETSPTGIAFADQTRGTGSRP